MLSMLYRHVQMLRAMHCGQACAHLKCYANFYVEAAMALACRSMYEWEYGMDDSEMLLISIQKCICSYRGVHPTVEI